HVISCRAMTDGLPAGAVRSRYARWAAAATATLVVSACSFPWEDYEPHPASNAVGGATSSSVATSGEGGLGPASASSGAGATAASGSGAGGTASGAGGVGASGGASTSSATASSSASSGTGGGMPTGDCSAPFVVADPSTQNGDNTGQPNTGDPSCMPGNSGDVVYQVTVSQTGVLDLTLDSAFDMGIYVQTSCG